MEQKIIWYSYLSTRHYWLVGLGIIAIFAITLWVMGQVPICKCGYIKLWHGIVASSENSQHISDWYSFSHIIHGFAFYLLFWKFGRRWPIGLRLMAALLLETSWEIFENTDFTINRYREVTISREYYGDSVVNAIWDVLFMVFGFLLAWRLPVKATVALLIFMEVFVGYFIRDNLTLNIIMLIYPFESILRWQTGAYP